MINVKIELRYDKDGTHEIHVIKFAEGGSTRPTYVIPWKTTEEWMAEDERTAMMNNVNWDKVNCTGQWFTIGLFVGSIGMAIFFSLAGVRIPL